MCQKVQVVAASHRKTEPKGFRIFRKRGHDAVLFLHFLTPAKVIIDGKAITTTRNACIIYTPGMCHDFGAATDTAVFESNCVAFRTNVIEFFAKFKVVLNEPFYINNEKDITKHVEMITWSAANKLQSFDERIDIDVHELFTLIEHGTLGINSKDLRDIHVRQRFLTMRGAVNLDPRGWTVEKMAKHCWLARSRFYVLYKLFFGTNPSDDLAAMILEYAKERLVNTKDSVAVIAEDCGYKKVESFIRMFSNKENITPGQYRKQKNRTNL